MKKIAQDVRQVRQSGPIFQIPSIHRDQVENKVDALEAQNAEHTLMMRKSGNADSHGHQRPINDTNRYGDCRIGSAVSSYLYRHWLR